MTSKLAQKYGLSLDMYLVETMCSVAMRIAQDPAISPFALRNWITASTVVSVGQKTARPLAAREYAQASSR